MPSKLLALTDEQLTTVFNMAALWRAIAADASSKMWRSLGDLPELGDGVVARTCAEVQKRYWRAPDLSRAAGDQQVSLSHLFALLIVLAPAARYEVNQRAFAHEGDASPIAIDVPGGSFADEFAQRIAWAEA